jgi:hypothetical protein
MLLNVTGKRGKGTYVPLPLAALKQDVQKARNSSDLRERSYQYRFFESRSVSKAEDG